MFYGINMFFLFSFLGFLFENLLTLILNSNFDSGILYGPWTFIYGFAILVIMSLNKFLEQRNLKKWMQVIIFYICAAIFMTLIEFTAGMLIEKLFHVVYWDYTKMKFNYGRYICLEVSLLWGLLATLVNYLIRPWMAKLARKIPKFITIIVVVIFIVDVILTVMK